MPFRKQWQSPLVWLTVLFLAGEFSLQTQAIQGTHILRWDIAVIGVVMLVAFLALLAVVVYQHRHQNQTTPAAPPPEPPAALESEPVTLRPGDSRDSDIPQIVRMPPRRPG